ncbi:hypothetical protein QJQ45_005587 [Haematococcus lacustris]|nr:hypothetical protein QJQ45_005587 [Haematococcus lacustris]
MPRISQGPNCEDQGSRSYSTKDVRLASSHYSSLTRPAQQAGLVSDTHPTSHVSWSGQLGAGRYGAAVKSPAASGPVSQQWLRSAAAAAAVDVQLPIGSPTCDAAGTAAAEASCCTLGHPDTWSDMADSFMASCCSPQPAPRAWPALALPPACPSLPSTSRRAPGPAAPAGRAAGAGHPAATVLTCGPPPFPAHDSHIASPTQPLLGSQSTLTKQAASLALPIPLGSPVLGLLHADAEQAGACPQSDGGLCAGHDEGSGGDEEDAVSESGSWGSQASVLSLALFLTPQPSST